MNQQNLQGSTFRVSDVEEAYAEAVRTGGYLHDPNSLEDESYDADFIRTNFLDADGSEPTFRSFSG